ncbi:carbamoyltransferase, partial [Streptomyces sp. TRM76130]|nr:carbamoyltransferase [Streptomyces sp. TRM76130]
GGRYTLCRPHDPENGRVFDDLFEKYFGPYEDTVEYKASLAAAAQEMLTAVTSHQLRALEARTELNHLLFEGGLALNCVNNTKLLEGSRFEDMSVSFGASDTGVVIGAAVHAWANHPDTTAEVRFADSVTPYLGPEYDSATIEQTLREFTGRVRWTRLAEDEVVDRVAKLLT